jgi:hypothetical protein
MESKIRSGKKAWASASFEAGYRAGNKEAAAEIERLEEINAKHVLNRIEEEGKRHEVEQRIEKLEEIIEEVSEQKNSPCGDALDKLWQDIMPHDYGDWEYPGMAYRHLKAEFDDKQKRIEELESGRFDHDRKMVEVEVVDDGEWPLERGRLLQRIEELEKREGVEIAAALMYEQHEAGETHIITTEQIDAAWALTKWCEDNKIHPEVTSLLQRARLEILKELGIVRCEGCEGDGQGWRKIK